MRVAGIRAVHELRGPLINRTIGPPQTGPAVPSAVRQVDQL